MKKDYVLDGLDVAKSVLLETSFDDAKKEKQPIIISYHIISYHIIDLIVRIYFHCRLIFQNVQAINPPNNIQTQT
jgi:hypothetical protein